ncbi:MAG: DNA gyrase subunit A [Patescibacteria group bacterium]|nr:DNA gyrase subunit A [Patescibacteria group bacterium]
MANDTSKHDPKEAPKQENIIQRSIIEEMKTSYIDYSMSVIVSRALPDVRDGLKPSQRRILVVLNDLGLAPNAHYRKSAKIAGDTTGNYHPHGESIVYPTMVKLAQKFNMRYILVDGQGNFGSIDGDPPAQMRYTEARMTKITQKILSGIDKGTVIYTPNYDGTRLEPSVLPSAIPNLICNGADGIAVGMATKIPPHNLGEVIDALASMLNMGNQWNGTAIYNTLRKDREKTEEIPLTLQNEPEDYISAYVNPQDPDFEKKTEEIKARLSLNAQNSKEEQPEKQGVITIYPQFESDITLEEIMKHIPGPDFPTYGQIYDREEIKNAYATGRGRILCRAKASIEEREKTSKFQIVVTEIPYQVNKAHLIEKIANLVKNKRITGISDLRDESDMQGIRVVIELKKTAQPKAVLNKLYKYTEMQKSYNANMIALVNGQPQTLTLKQILEHYLTHRTEVTIRKFEFELAQSKYRSHILEGLRIALDHLDEIIKTIRQSKTQEDAKQNLIKKFDLTEVQSQAILDLQLRRLAALEREKIEDEYKQIQATIKDLEGILAAPEKIFKVIKTDLQETKKKYADERRTKIYKGKIDEIAEEDMITSEETFITLSHSGYIKRMPPSTYKVQNRGGKGITGATTKEGDYIEHAMTCNTHDEILFFTNTGRTFAVKAYEIPEYGRTAKGIPAVNLIQLEQDEIITTLLSRGQKGVIDEAKAKNEDGQQPKTAVQPAKYLFMATKYGTVKKTSISQFQKIRSSGLISIKLDKGDELKWVRPSTGENNIILVTQYGRSILFNEKDVRPTGRNTRGVRGIKFQKEGDELVSMGIVRDEKHMLLTISENGSGKMTELKEYPLQGRAGQGVFTFRVTDKTGNVVIARILDQPQKELVMISRKGHVIRSKTKQIAQLKRQTSGVRMMRMNKGDSVAAMAFV